MSADYLARVAAIAERERAKAASTREEMRARYPEFAAFVDELRGVFGAVHAVTVEGRRYGKAELPFRRDQKDQPRIPGVTNERSDRGVRGAKSGNVARKNRGLPRHEAGGGDEGSATSREWWRADDDGD